MRWNLECGVSGRTQVYDERRQCTEEEEEEEEELEVDTREGEGSDRNNAEKE